jgi:maltooligosyltrehalose trehalohydrolase
MPKNKQMNLGATVEVGGVRFRVWAPKCQSIDVILDNQQIFPLKKKDHGYFDATILQAEAGMLYRYRINGQEKFPDPCSRFQPEGPHGPSMIVDPDDYQWQDHHWLGKSLKGQVLYEMHIGAYTPEGTFDAAADQLEELKNLGITVIEVMPVAEFPGEWNQGYDGASLFAPSHLYGDANAFKRFVDRAHSLGLGVILDVVYNHFGPDGNYTGLYSDDYLSDRHKTPWGDGVNFDGPNSQDAREFFLTNTCYWIDEFHLDGLRVDSTQDIHDDSQPHILAEIAMRTRQIAAPRHIILIAENEPQNINIVRPLDEGGYGFDGVWNDDFHHAAIVALKGRSEAYYTDYKGNPQEFISLLKRGYLYQGQSYSWQGNTRGTIVKNEPASCFVFYLQNHDQIANELRGERIHALTDWARYKAMTAILLLAPETPLLFMGQEFGASSPFLFFADHSNPELARTVFEGRKKSMEQFASFASAYKSPSAKKVLHDIGSRASFERSKLDLSERQKNEGIYQFHKDLLRIRNKDPVFGTQDRFAIDGAVLDPFSCAIRFFGKNGDDRLLLVNFGKDLEYHPIPEPLLAPSEKGFWELIWSSDDPLYGGPGVLNPFRNRGWFLPGQSAVLLRSASKTDHLHPEDYFKSSQYIEEG